MKKYLIVALFFKVLFLSFNNDLIGQEIRTAEDTVTIFKKINAFPYKWQQKICKNIFLNCPNYAIQLDTIAPHYFYDTIFVSNNIVYAVSNDCFMEPSCSAYLFAMDTSYRLLSVIKTYEIRHSIPKVEIVNYVTDSDIELLVTLPDNPSANTFAEISLVLYKFNRQTQKLVSIFEEYSYSCSYQHFCSRTVNKFTWWDNRIDVMSVHTKLQCDEKFAWGGLTETQSYHLKPTEPPKISNYVFEWDWQQFSFLLK